MLRCTVFTISQDAVHVLFLFWMIHVLQLWLGDKQEKGPKEKRTLMLAPQKKEVNFLPKPEIAGGKEIK